MLTQQLQGALDERILAVTPSLNAVTNEVARVWAQAVGRAVGKLPVNEPAACRAHSQKSGYVTGATTVGTVRTAGALAVSSSPSSAARPEGICAAAVPKHALTALNPSAFVTSVPPKVKAATISGHPHDNSKKSSPPHFKSISKSSGSGSSESSIMSAGKTIGDTNTSTTTDTSGKKRKRAPKFAASKSETVIIFKQIATNVPWINSRNKVAAVWMQHLKVLQEKGQALGCNRVRTFTEWAKKICNDRKVLRAKRLTGTVDGIREPSEEDVIDDVIDIVAATSLKKMEQLQHPGSATPFHKSQENLRSVSAQALGDTIAAISPDYSGYSAMFVRAGFDGMLLSDVVDDADLQHLVQEVGIEDAMHRRRVLVQLRSVRAKYQQP